MLSVSSKAVNAAILPSRSPKHVQTFGIHAVGLHTRVHKHHVICPEGFNSFKGECWPVRRKNAQHFVNNSLCPRRDDPTGADHQR